MVEDKFSPSFRRTRTLGTTLGQLQTRQRNLVVEESQPPRSTFLPRGSVVLSKTGVWRLTDVEIQLRREKGLCYRYDEKFSLGHRCKRRELNVMVVQGESDLEEEIEEELIQAEPFRR